MKRTAIIASVIVMLLTSCIIQVIPGVPGERGECSHIVWSETARCFVCTEPGCTHGEGGGRYSSYAVSERLSRDFPYSGRSTLTIPVLGYVVMEGGESFTFSFLSVIADRVSLTSSGLVYSSDSGISVKVTEVDTAEGNVRVKVYTATSSYDALIHWCSHLWQWKKDGLVCCTRCQEERNAVRIRWSTLDDRKVYNPSSAPFILASTGGKISAVYFTGNADFNCLPSGEYALISGRADMAISITESPRDGSVLAYLISKR